MSFFTQWVEPTVNYLKNDYREWPFRFIMELIAWALSIACALIIALTLPNPPFLYVYPMFMTQCALFGWGAWTRGSVGMTANCFLLVCIDMFGYIRFLNQ
ncbi:hypothetical protein UFOVP116_328 [uncultured Caudovirales phage]|uniref:Uncharacterized protein n=1 Tax=uncultured Caudovirales phage TaxID=2100421 RepID=A0A6J5LB21_9CAUD|nr:hypothetical protein UFOVP116_328 [uncultured Caudovirales phage]